MGQEAACFAQPSRRTSDHDIAGWATRSKEIGRALGIPVFLFVTILATLTLLSPSRAVESVQFVGSASLGIGPFFLASIAFGAYSRAAGLDRLISRVFIGSPLRMILVAAIFGAFSPFCSCGVIPVVAGLLAAGVPLAPVMTFWIASPSMDPELFFLIAGSLGVQFAVVKTLAVLIISVLAGLATSMLARLGMLQDILRAEVRSGCGSAPTAKTSVQWAFWHERDRRSIFGREFGKSALLLGRWLILAFLLESLMLTYVPASLIASWLGSESAWSVPLAAALGVPAYMNSYAAVPLVSGLIELGMSPAVGLTFLLAGTTTSLPAALAVWATVRKRVFAAYMVAAGMGAVASGYAYAALLSFS